MRIRNTDSKNSRIIYMSVISNLNPDVFNHTTTGQIKYGKIIPLTKSAGQQYRLV